jgi:hypothetical protein
MAQKLFVLGTGRCGTHTLHAILNSVPRTIALHEGATAPPCIAPMNVGKAMSLNIYLHHLAPDRAAALLEACQPAGRAEKIAARDFSLRHTLIKECEASNTHFCEASRLLTISSTTSVSIMLTLGSSISCATGTTV